MGKAGVTGGARAGGHIEVIEDAYSFTPEDQPEALASALSAFVTS